MRHLSILMNAPTLLVNTTTTGRVAGFSDSWYDSASTSQQLEARDRTLLEYRAALLPQSSSIVGVRISLLDEFGKSAGRSRPYRFPLQGGQSTQTDDPRMSLKYSLYGDGTTNELQYYLQNVPDARIQTGEYLPNATWETEVRRYFDYVWNQQYAFFGWNQTLPLAPIINITEAGVVTVERGNVWNVGQYVRVIDTRTVLRGNYRQNVNGHFVKVSVGNTVTLENWTAGACEGGTLQTWGKVLCRPFADPTQIAAPLVCTRKVGRPFFQYRGRASNRA